MIDNSLGFYLTLWMKCFFIVEVKLLHEMDRCASNDIIFAKIDMEQHQLLNATYEWTIGNFCPTSITFSSSWHGIPDLRSEYRYVRRVASGNRNPRTPAKPLPPDFWRLFFGRDVPYATTTSMKRCVLLKSTSMIHCHWYTLKRHGIESKYKS